MHGTQDFAKYLNAVPSKPAVTLWMPDIPSLLLGAVLGPVFTLAASSKMSTIKVPNTLEPSQLVAEQPREQSIKFEFYEVLKKGQ